MLAVWRNTGGEPHIISGAAGNAALSDAVWIDAVSPTAPEAAAVEQAAGIHVAAEAELSEIETSSRIAERQGVLYLSLPWFAPDAANGLAGVSIGFAVSADRFLTVRHAPVAIIDSFADRLRQTAPPPASGAAVFILLLETMVDALADRLERIHADLDVVSRRIFAPHDRKGSGPATISTELRAQLRAIGQAGETISGIRDTLLAFGRMLPFIARPELGWLADELRARIRSLRRDVVSLTDYDSHLTDKAQFLLDAILGFINIEQSNIIKLMTVVGVVGVPPTLIASIYGMNFQNMPELHLPYAYPVALLVILLSAVIPVLWFRRRGWL